MPLRVLTASGHFSRHTFDGCPLIDEVQECTFTVVCIIFSLSHDTRVHVGGCAVRLWCNGLHVCACLHAGTEGATSRQRWRRSASSSVQQSTASDFRVCPYGVCSLCHCTSGASRPQGQTGTHHEAIMDT